MQICSVGLLEVASSGDITEVDGSLVIDFGAEPSGVEIEFNGRSLRATTAAGVAAEIERLRRAAEQHVLSIPYEVEVAGSRVVIRQTPDLTEALSGAYLTGAAAEAAIAKSHRIVGSNLDTWPEAAAFEGADVKTLEDLTRRERWDGPLVVSMPRTGSTLMGILFLLAHDAGSATGYRFDRYVHEPAAPVFWRHDDVASIAEFISTPLTDRDVVQESAYQFTHPALAGWFLTGARPPVVFTVRHPQLAWPSRWRALLAKMVSEQPGSPDAETAAAALAADDFSGLGRYLTDAVRPADNGFYSFISLVGLCIREGIEFVIIDNTRFRDHPEQTLRQLSRKLDIDFDPAMTEWRNLDEASSRILMSDLALGEEYEWYYSGTLGSESGIRPETHRPVDPSRFPPELRGVSERHLTIDEAVTWHQLLLTRPETMA